MSAALEGYNYNNYYFSTDPRLEWLIVPRMVRMILIPENTLRFTTILRFTEGASLGYPHNEILRL